MGIFNFFRKKEVSEIKPVTTKEETKQIIRYHENGKLKIQGTLDADGEIHGNMKERYSNGIISKDQNFNHGIPHGTIKNYFENGKLFQERNFNNGLEDGKSYEYYENGVLNMMKNFKEGKEHGLQEQYYPNGNLEFRATFEEGKLEGVKLLLDENGEVLENTIFQEGLEITNELTALMLENDSYHLRNAILVADGVYDNKTYDLTQIIYDYYKFNNLRVENTINSYILNAIKKSEEENEN